MGLFWYSEGIVAGEGIVRQSRVSASKGGKGWHGVARGGRQRGSGLERGLDRGDRNPCCKLFPRPYARAFVEEAGNVCWRASVSGIATAKPRSVLVLVLLPACPGSLHVVLSLTLARAL